MENSRPDDSLYTVEEISEIVEQEGLGYAILDYVDPELIEDETLKRLWDEAKSALLDVDEFLSA